MGDAPAVAVALVDVALVEPRGLALPELDPLGDEAIAAPERRARHFVREARFDLVDAFEEKLARGEDLALPGSPRADLAAAGARPEIGVALGGGDALDPSFGADLLLDVAPEKTERRVGVRLELVRLSDSS